MLRVLFAFGSAFFAGITAVLAKIGIEHINSTLATAIRTVVVLAFSWLMVFVAGSQNGIGQIAGGTLLFLVLSGLSTGASWLCYFKALQLGDVNKVAPIDRSSTVLTILLAFVFLGEPVSLPQVLGVLGITEPHTAHANAGYPQCRPAKRGVLHCLPSPKHGDYAKAA